MRGRTPIILCIFLILSMTAYAVPDWSASSNDETGSGLYLGSTTANWDRVNGTAARIVDRVIGNDLVPKAIDIDGTYQYFIGTNDDTLIAYEYNSTIDTIIPFADFTMGNTIRGFAAGLGDHTNGNPLIAVVASSSACDNAAQVVNISVIAYDDTTEDFIIVLSNQSTLTNPCTDMRCKNFTGGNSGSKCYFGSYGNQLSEYDLTTNDHNQYNLGGSFPFGYTYNTQSAPVFGDLDDDGADEIAFIYWNSGWTYEVPAAINQDNIGGGVDYTQAIFNQDKELITSISIYDADNDGDLEIVGAYYNDEDAGDILFFTAEYNGAVISLDSHVQIQANAAGERVSEMTNLIAGNYVDDMTYPTSCAIATINDAGVYPVNVYCYSFTDLGSAEEYELSADCQNCFIEDGFYIAGASFFSDSPSVSMIATSTGIIDMDIERYYAYDASNPQNPTSRDTHVCIGDGTNDGNLDIFTMGGSESYMIVPELLLNQPPTEIGKYGQNLCGQICLDTFRTYSAQECGIGLPTQCNYVNDATVDQERIVSTCGNTTAQINGTYQNTAPTLSCYFDSTGARNFRLYLEDEFNEGDRSAYRNMNEFVINGTAGIDCNIPCSNYQAFPQNETSVIGGLIASDEGTQDIANAVEEYTDALTLGNSLTLKLFAYGSLIGFVIFLYMNGIKDVFIVSILFSAMGYLWTQFRWLTTLEWGTMMFIALAFAFISLLMRGFGGGEG